jgi:hypothetical protein
VIDNAAMKTSDGGARILEQRRQDRRVARAFVEAAEAGELDRFLALAGELDKMTLDGWLPLVTEGIRSAFVSVWIDSQTFQGKVRDRRVLASGLRVLLPAITAARRCGYIAALSSENAALEHRGFAGA